MISTSELRQAVAEFLRFQIPEVPVPFEVEAEAVEDGYDRFLIRYRGDAGDEIPAYLLVPRGRGPFPAVLLQHQHNSERHLGKSEVCGLAGDPLQAFGPVLARRGIVVLAPDSICFEDRRHNRSGIEPDEDGDWRQHYNEMCYRLLRGDTLMRKVLDDAARAVSLLLGHTAVDGRRIGTMGHSYGGNTVLFHAAVDTRLSFACTSGAVCSFEDKMINGTGIEMAEVLPGFINHFEIDDLLRCMAPRKVLVVSAMEDKFSRDADLVVERARDAFEALGQAEQLEHKRYAGGHALTQERFDDIWQWVVQACNLTITG